MWKLSELSIVESKDALIDIPDGKVLINTINAHSYNVAQKDETFAECLIGGGFLIPDGASIVKACKFLNAKCQPKERIAGWDLFAFEMQRLNGRSKKDDVRDFSGKINNRVMFLGSSEKVLAIIKERVAMDYPNLEVLTFSPPYKSDFSEDDSRAMVQAINRANPDLLWIGMTAPKQEKWTYQHWKELNIHCHVGTIGAVFDFYAGTAKRAPKWWQEHSLEWLYRLIKEPRRMWRRYIIGNPLFVWNILKEKWRQSR